MGMTSSSCRIGIGRMDIRIIAIVFTFAIPSVGLGCAFEEGPQEGIVGCGSGDGGDGGFPAGSAKHVTYLYVACVVAYFVA